MFVFGGFTVSTVHTGRDDTSRRHHGRHVPGYRGISPFGGVVIDVDSGRALGDGVEATAETSC